MFNRTPITGLQNNRNYFSALALLLILAIAARLPRFFSGNLLPNGDESLAGIMAEELLNGKGFFLFMHSQCYGLSFPETGMTALFFLLFGASGLTLKVSMLTFWSLGWAATAAASSLWFGRKASLVSGSLLALMPAWGAFSLYARGGYLTAFLITGILFILAWHSLAGRGRSSLIWSLFTGAGLSLLLFSQLFWIPGTAAALALLWYEKSGKRPILLAPLISGTVISLPALLALRSCTAWWQPPVFANLDIIRALISLPGRFAETMSGTYIYHRSFFLGPLSEISGVVYGLSAAGLILYSVISLVKKRRINPMLPWGTAVILSASATLFINYRFYGNRFLLPAAGFLPLLAGAAFRHLADCRDKVKYALLSAYLVILLLSLGALLEFRNFTYDGKSKLTAVTEQQAYRGLLDRLKWRKIKHLYVYDPMPVFHWQLMFPGREGITTRWFSGRGRVPSNAKSVDAALVMGEPVAVTGKIEQLGEVKEKLGLNGEDPRIRKISNRYFILLKPDVTEILRLGFSLRH